MEGEGGEKDGGRPSRWEEVESERQEVGRVEIPEEREKEQMNGNTCVLYALLKPLPPNEGSY